MAHPGAAHEDGHAPHRAPVAPGSGCVARATARGDWRGSAVSRHAGPRTTDEQQREHPELERVFEYAEDHYYGNWWTSKEAHEQYEF